MTVMLEPVLKKDTKVTFDGKGDHMVRMSNLKGTGGEGSAYLVEVGGESLIAKFYKDPAKMRKDRMVKKIALLAKTFPDLDIAGPKGLLLKGTKPVGYYMRFVEGTSMITVFGKKYWRRTPFKNEHALLVCNRILELGKRVHDKGWLMLDPNELNWILEGLPQDFTPVAIDVDAWQGAGFNSDKVMPAYRDYHTKGYNTSSDWFSIGALMIRLLIGIGPYDGEHADYTLKSCGGSSADVLEKRMRANISIFNKDVVLPTAARGLDTIPGPLHDWLKATFEDGKRGTIPPSPFNKGTVTTKGRKRTKVTAGKDLTYTELFSNAKYAVVRVFHCGIIQLEGGLIVDPKSGTHIARVSSGECEVMEVDESWLVVGKGKKGAISGLLVDKTTFDVTKLQIHCFGSKVVSFENRIFLVTNDGLTELLLIGTMLMAGSSCPALDTTQWLEGVGVENLQGHTHIILPFGTDATARIRVPELDGLTISDGKAGLRFASFVGMDQQGLYHRIDLAFTRSFSNGGYDTSITPTQLTELNMAILPKKDRKKRDLPTVASVNKDGELVLSLPTTPNSKPTILKDAGVTTDAVVANQGTNLVIIRDGVLYGVKKST